MVTVEDALKLIAMKMSFNSSAFKETLNGDWYQSFITNVYQFVVEDRSLSTEQGRIILKILNKVRYQLVTYGDVTDEEITQLLRDPQYRKPPYKSADIKREVRYMGDNIISFRFKFNDVLMRDMRSIHTAWFDREHRIWLIPVTSATYDEIRRMISTYRFLMDADARKYLDLCYDSAHKHSSFSLNEEFGVIIANVCDNELLAKWIIDNDGELI